MATRIWSDKVLKVKAHSYYHHVDKAVFASYRKNYGFNDIKALLYFSVLSLMLLFNSSLFAQTNDHLEQLVKRAIETNTDALIISKDGEIIKRYYKNNTAFEQIDLASATKSIVSLSIGRLLTTGQLDSLDQPVYTIFPEWNQGKKKYITVRHLLNHSSGLQNVTSPQEEIAVSSNIIQLALCAEVEFDPGTNFSYNNKAFNLLSGIIERLSGQKLDSFVYDQLFVPLDIHDYSWGKDDEGNVYGMSELSISAQDLLKFGQLMLHQGTWNNQTIISKQVIKDFLTPSVNNPYYGCGWWLSPEHISFVVDEDVILQMQSTAVHPDYLEKARIALGKYESVDSLRARLLEIFGDNYTEIIKQNYTLKGAKLTKMVASGDLDSYYASGSGGKYLVIVPSKKLVAVRLIRKDSHVKVSDSFNGFIDLVNGL